MAVARKPYLIRAMYEWICDSDYTPHIVVDADAPGVSVPQQHVSDSKIILNISQQATDALNLGNDTISCATRFGGTAHTVQVPTDAVLGIYARETGEGMIFTDEKQGPDDGDDDPPQKPTLKIVK